MLTFVHKIAGLTPEELARRGKKIRPLMTGAMRKLMREGRKLLVKRAKTEFKKRSGRTLAALRKSKIKAWIRGNIVVGRITHQAFLLNIFLKGATIRSREIRPTRKRALMFVVGGRTVFAKRVQTQTFHLRPRPIETEVFQQIVKNARPRLAEIVRETVLGR